MPVDGIAVRILRELEDKKPDEFSAEIGVSASYLRDIETCRRTLKRNPELVEEIAKTLGVPRRMVEGKSLKEREALREIANHPRASAEIKRIAQTALGPRGMSFAFPLSPIAGKLIEGERLSSAERIFLLQLMRADESKIASDRQGRSVTPDDDEVTRLPGEIATCNTLPKIGQTVDVTAPAGVQPTNLDGPYSVPRAGQLSELREDRDSDRGEAATERGGRRARRWPFRLRFTS